MIDDERIALIHAELDGDLSSQQRADLARLLLGDPQVRALRDELRDLGSRLDALDLQVSFCVCRQFIGVT